MQQPTYKASYLSPGDDLADAYRVRTAVFVDEQGFDPATEIDDTDPVAHHVVLYDGGEVVATGRVFPGEGPGEYIVGRVAVLAGRRGGAGRVLMGHLEQLAGSLGAREITLGAQCRVQGFYEKLGYRCHGDLYYDEHCPHTHMSKTL